MKQAADTLIYPKKIEFFFYFLDTSSVDTLIFEGEYSDKKN